MLQWFFNLFCVPRGFGKQDAFVAENIGSLSRIFFGMIVGWFLAWHMKMIYISCSKTRRGGKVEVKGKEITETPVTYGEAWVVQLAIVFHEFVNTWSYSEQFEALFALGFALGQSVMIAWDGLDRLMFKDVNARVQRFHCQKTGTFEFLHVLCIDPWFWAFLFIAMLRLVAPKRANPSKPKCANPSKPNGAADGDGNKRLLRSHYKQ